MSTVQNETRNNTSAVDSFPGSYTGLAPAGNTSKTSFIGLLGPKAPRVMAHLMPWWRKDGSGGHRYGKTVGYDSPDPNQVTRQIADMAEAGIGGVIIDWYGRPKTDGSKWEDDCTKEWFRQSLDYPDFFVCLILDAGAYRSTQIVDKTAEYLKCADYAAANYFPHARYWRSDGRPVFLSFGDAAYNLDWKTIRSKIQGNPKLIFRNASGFTHAESDGAFSWLTQADVLTAGAKHPEKMMISSAVPGFDDRLAPWGKNRIISRGNGQTWLDTFKRTKVALDNDQRVDAVQLVTWNDYEEGSAMESGISGALAVYPVIVGTSDLQWTVSGNLNAIDHYLLFESIDGVNLNLIKTLPVGQRSFDLGSLTLSAGVHRFYIKAIGKSRIQNFFSRATPYAPTEAPAIKVTPADKATVSNPVTMTAVANMTGRVEIWLDGSKQVEATGTRCGITKNALSKGAHRVAGQLIVDKVVAAKTVSNITVA